MLLVEVLCRPWAGWRTMVASSGGGEAPQGPGADGGGAVGDGVAGGVQQLHGRRGGGRVVPDPLVEGPQPGDLVVGPAPPRRACPQPSLQLGVVADQGQVVDVA